MPPSSPMLPPELERLDLAILLLENREPVSRWALVTWSITGIVCRSAPPGRNLIREAGPIREYMFGGLRLRLHRDECESYYHNLVSSRPQIYVIARPDEADGAPEPFHVSASFDEANAYAETDEDVYPVDMPPEVYAWSERFVLSHYVPEPRRKRKRRDWKQEGLR